MHLIEPHVDIISYEQYSPSQIVELAGRVCYKSEDKISDKSDVKFIRNILKGGHESVIEHYNFVIKVNRNLYEVIKSFNPKFLNMSTNQDGYIISGSARGFKDLYRKTHSLKVLSIIAQLKTICPVLFDDIKDDTLCEDKIMILSNEDIKKLSLETRNKHQYITMHFVCDRAIANEIVRHRIASYSQESTRYCDYSKDKFKGISLICPPQIKQHKKYYFWWWLVSKVSEIAYKRLKKVGVTPEIARCVLPLSLKTELYMTCNLEELKYFINLRSTRNAHPQMVELMQVLSKELSKQGIFN